MGKEQIPVQDVINGINIEDKNLKIVFLSSGEYLIDGEVVTVSGFNKSKVQVSDISNIREITKNKVIKEYVCGEEKLSVRNYNEQRDVLLEKRKWDDNGYEVWESLEDEFAYKKFKQTWTPIYVVDQEISKPLLVQLESTKYDTGCEYIKNAFLNGENNDFTLYTYNQVSAWLGIVSECFKELKMEFKGDIGYQTTNNKKIWGNSSHSCIRYVTAFGTYVFNDDFKNPRVLTGTLEDMKLRYEKDKSKIREIIINKFNNHFGNIDAGKFDFERLKNILSRVENNLLDVNPKQKTYRSYELARKALNEAQDMIKVAYEVTNNK